MRVSIDLGGTFVDLALSGGRTRLTTVKSLADAKDLVGSVMTGLELLAQREGFSLPSFLAGTTQIVHGTTIATNSVLTGHGARVALLTTEGTRDALELRRGIKEEPLNNRFVGPTVLVPREARVGVTERIGADGAVIRDLDGLELTRAIGQALTSSPEAVAICYMHSYANDSHEARTGDALSDSHPEIYSTISSELAPRIGYYERVSTTVLNCFVGPAFGRYLTALEKTLHSEGFRGQLMIMTSAGGILTPSAIRPRASAALLSGPAAAPLAPTRGHTDAAPGSCTVIDIGGTSLDVSIVVSGRVNRVQGGKIGGYAVALPMVDVATVGAGGGSIAWIDDAGTIRVGPQSAGATPGPACYGLGGDQPTVTDAAMLLGRINEDSLERKNIPADRALAELALRKHIGDPLGLDVEDSAVAVFRVATALMVESIRDAVVYRGHDPGVLPLWVGGGAGPIVADALAVGLGAGDVYVPVYSATLCAVGLLTADLRHEAVRTYWAPLDEVEDERIEELVAAMIEEGQKVLGRACNSAPVFRELQALMQYSGQLDTIAVDVGKLRWSDINRDVLKEGFHREHERANGYALPSQPIELVSLVLSSWIPTSSQLAAGEADDATSPRSSGYRSVYLPDISAFQDVPVIDHRDLRHGRVVGPAVVELPDSSLLVPRAALASRTDALLIRVEVPKGPKPRTGGSSGRD